ncbi:streptomycin kinase [Variovorax paradoxus]|jgi:streptomycin 6-kinase|uniref:aminoglycoside phosphotransferase family protein n=1 Tax=Variovorax paradoxus TaxID=34073 RepID=UPI0006E603FE|nr:streptomycin kinase [Variovorax paradoxus]KPV10994.1 streptomycin kinase [Variovorax paradoxus]KPV13499.1 streptomycin kinase [Variovorax paradoxus]KPV24248.1 streptomycin kinase [Variovorax paradoxus]KPV32747.1 streptomycin kinase [Variovorax paradoxus]
MFEPYLQRWDLIPDGESFSSLSGHLLPVRARGLPAMLKLSHQPEEMAGAALMAWWDGQGAAAVLAQAGEALLMARAEGTASLARMARSGQDDDATRILCEVATRLHAPRGKPLPPLVPLTRWFASLCAEGAGHAGVLGASARTARALLAAPREACVLHGDIHHGNVLDFGVDGWLAIDPKGLVGERGFDVANIFCNPDDATALAPGRFERRLAIVAKAADIERGRLLQWVLAWAGLSSVWMIEDGDEPGGTLEVARQAAAALGIAH